jgi:hypothetical protein
MVFHLGFSFIKVRIVSVEGVWGGVIHYQILYKEYIIVWEKNIKGPVRPLQSFPTTIFPS